MNRAELEVKREAIMQAKRENAKMWELAESEVGKHLVERLQNDLQALRQKYSKIVTKGDAEEVVRRLIVIQAGESILTTELDRLTKYEERAKALDENLKEVNNTLQTMEKREESAR